MIFSIPRSVFFNIFVFFLLCNIYSCGLVIFCETNDARPQKSISVKCNLNVTYTYICKRDRVKEDLNERERERERESERESMLESEWQQN